MKKLLILFLAAGIIVSCNTTTDSSSDKTKAAEKEKAEKHVALVKEFIAAFDSGEVENWRDLCTDDFVTYGPKTGDEATLDEYIESMQEIYDAIDSLKSNTLAILPHTTDDEDLAGDYVFWWGSNSAYFIEAEKSVEIRLHTVYRIVDGKISFTSDYWDTGDLASQLKGEGEEKEAN